MTIGSYKAGIISIVVLGACLIGYSVTPNASTQVSTVQGEATGEKAGSIGVTEVVINEFLASNTDGIQDEDGNSSDWIELHNAGSRPVALEGWTLSDDGSDPGKWTFPAVTIDASGYLLVFASGKDRRLTNGDNLHTNFRLGASGEYLGLYDNGAHRVAVSEFTPEFPAQTSDRSYGLRKDGSSYVYFDTPTPNTANDLADHFVGFVAPPRSSVVRGFYDHDISLELTSPDPEATILYTLDGGDPTPVKGMKYTGPIAITDSTAVRAAAYRDEYRPSSVTTHTYILRASDLSKALPALVIAGDPEESLFNPNGIMAKSGRGETSYDNARERGRTFERPISIELIDPLAGEWNEDTGFQLNCGIRVHGSDFVRVTASRGEDWYTCDRLSSPRKFSFRFYFRSEYGPTQLDFPLFPVSPTTRFDQIVLRAGHNDGCNPFILDELCRRLHVDMGWKASTGTFANLFINGKFKSYYNPCERLDENTFQRWYTSDEQWDVVSPGTQTGGTPTGATEARDGDLDAWTVLLDYARTNDLSVARHYEEVARMLDIEAFIDYLIIQIYTGNWDWPGKNWTAARERTNGTALGKFRFYLWDCEGTFSADRIEDTAFNNFPFDKGDGLNGEDLPIPWLYRALKVNRTFRQLFEHRIQLHMFSGGALTEGNIVRRFNNLAEMIQPVLPAEIRTEAIDEFVPLRTDIVLRAFAKESLYTPR